MRQDVTTDQWLQNFLKTHPVFLIAKHALNSHNWLFADS